MAEGIALLGFGCVGQGVADILAHLHAQQPGTVPPIRHVVVAHPETPREITPPVPVTTDPTIALSDDVSIVVEVNGEVDHNRELITAALRAGKHVVTANKELLSLHLEQLCVAAGAGRAQLRYEAAVAGGVPVIRELLSLRRCHQILAIDGVLNGSCNFVLDALHHGRDRAEVVEEATRLGYLEADPRADFDGLDAQRKLRILASVALGGSVTEDQVLTASIAGIDATDIAFAATHGRVIKQVAHAHRENHSVAAWVLPTALSTDHPLASLSGVTNAVTVTTDYLGPLTLTGPGAGRYATGSAVVGDILGVLTGEHIDVSPGTITLTSLNDQLKRRWYVRCGNAQLVTEPMPISAVDGDVVVAWD